MFQACIAAGCWDLEDLGVEHVLDAVQACGATGVTIVVAAPPVAMLRADGRVSPRLVRTPGGLYFSPKVDAWENTRLKPPGSAARYTDVLLAARDAAVERSLDFRLRCSATRIGRVAGRHSEAAAATVFEDAAPLTLCAANPDVRAMFLAVVEDLMRQFEPQRLEVADLASRSGWDDAPRPHTASREPGLDALAGLCFATSCRQAARESGADPAAAARSVTLAIDKLQSGGAGTPGGLSAWCRKDKILGAYVTSQRQSLTALLDSAVQIAGERLSLVWPTDAHRCVTPAQDAIADEGGPHVVVSATAGPDALATACAGAPAVAAERRELRVAIDGSTPAASDALVGLVQDAAADGWAGATIEPFGLIGKPSWDAIRQAFRFAKRTAR